MTLARLLMIFVVCGLLVLVDLYAWQGVRAAIVGLGPATQKGIAWGYWVFTSLTVLVFVYWFYVGPYSVSQNVRTVATNVIFASLLTKVFMVFFVLLADLWRAGQWLAAQLGGNTEPATTATTEATPTKGNGIIRSTFLARTGVVVATMPLVAMGYGIISGAHDYRIRRRTVYLPNLPKGFDGLRIAQISDIHSGSFWNRTAVKGGVELLMQEKPDMVFFTGDMVNNEAKEMSDYVNVFDKVKADLGVFSTLGNHDYGDYVQWPNAAAKRQNLADVKEVHRLMGWQLLNNAHHMVTQGGDKLAVVGVENWSAKGRFPKHGRLAEALAGTEEAATKLLLSHDPSHWRAQVLPQHPDVDLAFAGHTHGMQFGVEVGGIKWSPVKYMYPEWADLYSEGHQYLYVNRGFGYLGYPGRIGMPPEITLITLKQGEAR